MLKTLCTVVCIISPPQIQYFFFIDIRFSIDLTFLWKAAAFLENFPFFHWMMEKPQTKTF